MVSSCLRGSRCHQIGSLETLRTLGALNNTKDKKSIRNTWVQTSYVMFLMFLVIIDVCDKYTVCINKDHLAASSGRLISMPHLPHLDYLGQLNASSKWLFCVAISLAD